MNSITITRLYDQLSSKLGKETAESLITFIEQKIREELADHKEALADKAEMTNFYNQRKTDKKFRFW
jgi:predicted house-cleaning noncanonical NTP pyrophosphatase (MazG superfamily)